MSQEEHPTGGPGSLTAVLEKIAANDLRWCVLEFHGIGTAPGGVTMPEFEAVVQDRGHEMTWPAVLAFARGTEQVWDCLIAALSPDDGRSAIEVRDVGLEGACVVIDRQDVDPWRLNVTDPAWLASDSGEPWLVVTVGAVTTSDDLDVDVLERLAAAGSDLSKPAHVVFFVWCGSRAGAQHIADGMRDTALRAEIEPPLPGDDRWLCRLEGTFVPSLETVRDYGAALEALCDAVDGEYDGWEAQIVR